MEFLHRLAEEFPPLNVQSAMHLDLIMPHLGVGATSCVSGEAFPLKDPGAKHAFPNGLRGFGSFFTAEFLVLNRGGLDMNVDAIKQWPGNPIAVTLDLFWRAAAFPLRITKISAGARVHRGDQHHICREGYRAGRSADRNFSVLQAAAAALRASSV